MTTASHWTHSPPEQDGIYWFSLTGDARVATPEGFNRTADGVMRFSRRAPILGPFYPANHFENAIWWSEPLVRPESPTE